MVEFDVSGGIVMAGTRILLPIALATVLPGVAIPLSGSISNINSLGTIGTITSLVAVTGTVNVVGPGDTGTIATIQSPVGVVGTIATILSQSPVVVTQGFVQTNIKAAVALFGSSASTIQAGTLQDLVVDCVFGTVVTGSIQVSVLGVEPQTGVQTSTLLAGSWFAGTVQAGQRLQVLGPLGAFVAVKWQVPTGSVLAVSITAQQSATS